MTRKPLSTRIEAALETQWPRRAESVVCLTLPFPISTNRLWRPAKGTMVKTKRYLTWCRDAGNEINRQRPGRINGAYHVRIVIERKSGRNRIDQDNGIKCVMDCLQEHGVIENDRLTIETNVSWSEHMKGAYIVLTAVAATDRVAA